jgi:hypothetical protein
MTSTVTPSMKLVGYEARASDGTVMGEIESVDPNGMRIHRIPGLSGGTRYLPAEVIARVDEPTRGVLLVSGIGLEHVLNAPPDDFTGAWYNGPRWRAELLRYYRLFGRLGRTNGRPPRPDQQ